MMRSKNAGFSFLEVLISLLIVTSTVLPLLRQQMRVSQYIHRQVLVVAHGVVKDNQREVDA